MAEFQNIIRQINRLCEMNHTTSECANTCPLALLHKKYLDAPSCKGELLVHAKEVEQIISEWVAEHPEPVYPTWGEWLESEGICFSRLTNYEKVHGFTIPKVFEYQIDGKTAFICGDRVNSPIPADIAQKLGIKPKEG